MRNVTPEQVAMAEQHRRGELPDRIEGALGELAGAANLTSMTDLAAPHRPQIQMGR